MMRYTHATRHRSSKAAELSRRPVDELDDEPPGEERRAQAEDETRAMEQRG